MLEHFVLFRVASCNIMSRFWFVYMSLVRVAYILHQTSDTLHIPGTQQLFLVYKWHWYKV